MSPTHALPHRLSAPFIVACACLLVAGTRAVELRASGQEPEKRDLSRYEQGCEFTLRHWWGQMMDDEEGAKARVRAFLWERWRGKKMARCSIVIGYTHGDSRTTNYYVEPDREGRWRVAVETVSSCCSLEVLQAAMEGRKKELEVVTRVVGSYYLVGRVDAGSGQLVPEKEKRKPETYTLLFQDRKPTAKDETGPSTLTL